MRNDVAVTVSYSVKLQYPATGFLKISSRSSIKSEPMETFLDTVLPLPLLPSFVRSIRRNLPPSTNLALLVDHPVYRYRDIEKLGRICKTRRLVDKNLTSRTTVHHVCATCAPPLLQFSFLPMAGPIPLVLSSFHVFSVRRSLVAISLQDPASTGFHAG